ncbi:type IV toxin-antitoxin system AbiEi family antitoxin domain-containing protein [Microbacterium terricola]|uniref:Type IV toxin-antitoxin system AbiEi family antitoxin domain-containing protein n=1 Tax=Microbacterium terricola TaxID=344163 RepID=A0ABM8DXD6_9MICO|nr:type IV toxin-antitoxin system AbiEi family antitoxin domain-containing protein [Microbacterium terricola]UYK39043.1 type IV toxin-antitoxin system AbiEi family antitoxin domain-containing protein [Microbacterium terricola]BDV30249.1 hypothetical protein Microterr_09090 [Microbacterium terricola]
MAQRWQVRMAEAGGIASAGDLHRSGLDDMDVRIRVQYGLLVRVRRGWYALPDTPESVVAACRMGGRLACVSALRLLGEHSADGDRGDDRRIHVEVPANAVVRVPPDERERVRLHWARRPSPGDRAVVDAEAARRQALTCDG